MSENLYTKEPIIHSHISDMLPEDDKRAYDSIYCDNCGVMLHAFNNECMQTWVETEFGNYCTECWQLTDVLEMLSDNLREWKIGDVEDDIR